MTGQPPAIRVVLIDDHEAIRNAGPILWPGLAVVGTYANTEAFIASSTLGYEVIVLDLQLDGLGMRLPDGRQPAIGTRAVRNLLDAGHRPIVLYTGLSADGVIAGCLASGAQGAVSKNGSRDELVRVVRAVAAGHDVEVDTLMASALVRLERGHHAGGLSDQQYDVLRLCAKGLSQDRIAAEIGVSSRKSVENYLRSAIEKLSAYDVLSANSTGVVAAREAATALGFDSGLVDRADIEHSRRLAKRATQARTDSMRPRRPAG
jgi:DNA-binding NarL/FixJ family response regulator